MLQNSFEIFWVWQNPVSVNRFFLQMNLGKEVLLIVGRPYVSAFSSQITSKIYSKYVNRLSFLSKVSVSFFSRMIPMIIMTTIHGPVTMEIHAFRVLFSLSVIFRRDILRREIDGKRKREISSCDFSVEQISSHAYAHARLGLCQAMRRIRVANLYDKHFHRGQPVRVNTLVKKRWRTNGYRLFLPFEIGYLHIAFRSSGFLLKKKKKKKKRMYDIQDNLQHVAKVNLINAQFSEF